MDRERLRNEFKLFAKRNVKKINILDPEFNAGRRCIDTLKIMIEVGLKSKITVQARPENIVKMRWSEEYLELCKLLNIHMEFGLQTAIPREYDAVNRKNNLAQVSQAFFEMNQMGLSYEVSMIYGLPFQTVDSFKQSLKFLEDRDVPIVRCFPLMLHRGTKLDQERDAYDLQELVEPVYGINLVSSSDTFTYDEWLEMNLLANNGKGNFYYKTDHTIPHLEQMKSFT
jgi:radical SAM superfamily enzyme YgiQ (UPF0313 family)